MPAVRTYYDLILDSYLKVGYEYRFVTKEEYDNILKHQEDRHPVALSDGGYKENIGSGDANDANYWFEYDLRDGPRATKR